jgi:hypothetical protein
MDWKVVLQATDPNEAWSSFKNMFKEISDKHAPLVEVRVKGNQPPWFNEEILSLCKERDFYKGKAQKSASAMDWDIFRNIKNQTNNMIRQVKKSYYTSTIKENRNDGKQLWKIIKSILPSKAYQSIKDVNVDGEVISDPKEVANTFNNFFINIGQKLAQSFHKDTHVGNLPSYNKDPLHFINIDHDFVCKQLLKLSIGKATGIDGLSSRLLRT